MSPVTPPPNRSGAPVRPPRSRGFGPIACRFGAVLAGVWALSGCVSLLPKAPPAQLYRFDYKGLEAVQASPDARVSAGSEAFGVVLTGVELPRGALGDGILTVSGQRAAYVDGARWLTPAVVMFESDARDALAGPGSGVRLLDRSDLGAASALLRIDVSRFEADYPAGATGAAPTVKVALTATLSRPDGRNLVQKRVSVEVPAAADRVSAIVAAFSQATTSALDQVVGFVAAEAPGFAADRPVASPAAP